MISRTVVPSAHSQTRQLDCKLLPQRQISYAINSQKRMWQLDIETHSKRMRQYFQTLGSEGQAVLGYIWAVSTIGEACMRAPYGPAFWAACSLLRTLYKTSCTLVPCCELACCTNACKESLWCLHSLNITRSKSACQAIFRDRLSCSFISHLCLHVQCYVETILYDFLSLLVPDWWALSFLCKFWTPKTSPEEDLVRLLSCLSPISSWAFITVVMVNVTLQWIKETRSDCAAKEQK